MLMRVNCDDEWANTSTSPPNVEPNAVGSASGKSNGGIAPRRNNTDQRELLRRFLRLSDTSRIHDRIL